MTLGGFALAVGILVDNGTVVIENIERHVQLGEPLQEAIIGGAGEVGVPTVLATLCICIVFVPVFLLQGTAKYLFSPLSLAVCLSLIASLALSFTMVPVLFRYLMRGTVHYCRRADTVHESPSQQARSWNPFSAIHYGFDRGFVRFRERYRNTLAWTLAEPLPTVLFCRR